MIPVLVKDIENVRKVGDRKTGPYCRCVISLNEETQLAVRPTEDRHSEVPLEERIGRDCVNGRASP